MTLWHQLEHTCQTLKHTPEQLNPTDLRSLLRETQTTINAIEPLLNPQTLTIQQTENHGYNEYQITITTTLTHDQYHTLLHTITQHN
jgi:predicted component of type VI protein secretion system